MKSKLYFKFLFLFFSFLIFSCGGDDSNELTSISISSNEESLIITEQFTFSVKGNNGENITSDASILVNGRVIAGNTFSSDEAGTFNVNARYQNLTSNTISITIKAIEDPNSIILSVDQNSLAVGKKFTFSVTSDTGVDFTSLASITYNNGTDIPSNDFTASEVGTYEFIATYESFTSNTLSIEVTEKLPAFIKNVLIEDYTGIWCGYCPRVAFGIEEVQKKTNRAVVVALHRGSSNPGSSTYDPYNCDASGLEVLIGLEGYPTAMLNRTVLWDFPEPTNVPQVVSYTGDDADLGLAISSTLESNILSIAVNVKFLADYSTKSPKLVVYLLEDGIVKTQTNYTGYYGGNGYIPDFVHDHVARAAVSNLFGDAINPQETLKDSEYTANYSMTIPEYIEDSTKLSLAAFIVINNTVINARGAHVGTVQDYQNN